MRTRPNLSPAVYTHDEVATLFNVERTRLYEMPQVMQCRLPGKPLRYSMKRIDALLNMDTTHHQ